MEFPRYSAKWWKCGIQVKRDRLIPLEPFLLYNPFQWYWPQDKSTRANPSLPYVFLNWASSDIQHVANFCERYGVLGDTQRSWESWRNENREFPVFVKKVFPNFPETKQDKRLDAMIGVGTSERLLTGLSLDQFRIEQAGMRQLTSLIQQSTTAPPVQAKNEVRNLLRERFSAELTKVRPHLEWDAQNERWITGWDVLSLVAAMYLMLLLDMQGPGHILDCPRCRKVFLGDHPRTQYCSRSCQNVAKVNRWRKKHTGKQEVRESTRRALAKGGKSHGK
jgi:hypothetical protein